MSPVTCAPAESLTLLTDPTGFRARERGPQQ